MPTIYKRKAGSRRYIDYTLEDLEKCLFDVRSKILTQRDAAVKYNIPRSTIKNKLKNKHRNKPGHPTIFTTEEERSFVAHITALSEFSFPITDTDLKIIIKDYLSACGREVKQFKNNVPGNEWVRGFFRRNKVISKRFANNIKKVRADISEKVIVDFLEHLKSELDGIPADNIYNYDESNLSDDPGKKRVICRRGTKYPEIIVNATKVSFSVMFCGNAAGETIPPYVIFKAEHLWSTWTEHGPNGTSYNRTKSGWIDRITFEDWFMSHLLPILKKKPGPKVLIGDNLSSHININVLTACKANNIRFICLPANTTHILQPLDVAYFRPLKVKWRQVLLDWKNTTEGRRLPTVPKEQFPKLLKRALDSLKETQNNLINGFKKTGIFPLNKEEPLNRLPCQDRIIDLNLISDTFLQNLKKLRNNENLSQTNQTKKKKLNVPAGRSIRSEDIPEREQPGPSGISQTKSKRNNKKPSKGRPRKPLTSSTDTSLVSSVEDISLASSTEDLITARELSDNSEDNWPLICLTNQDPDQEVCNQEFKRSDKTKSKRVELNPQTAESVFEEEQLIISDLNRFSNQRLSDSQICNLLEESDLEEVQDKNESNVLPEAQSYSVEIPAVIEKEHKNGSNLYCDGDYVLVKWKAEIYPGQIMSSSAEGVLISCMKKGKFWKWPAIKDEQLYSWENVLKKINPPKFVKKGLFTVPEIDKVFVDLASI